MGVVGAAVVPLLMGKVADHDTATAYYLPIICYLRNLPVWMEVVQGETGEVTSMPGWL